MNGMFKSTVWNVANYAVRKGQKPKYKEAVGDDEYMGYVPTTVKYILKPRKTIKNDDVKKGDNIVFYGESLVNS